MFSPLSLPEPPAEAVALVLDELRTARRELADAGRIVNMLGIDPPEDGPHAKRLWIEQQTAEHRCELWAVEAKKAADRARALGLDVDATL